MIIPVSFALAALTVPLATGRLSLLATLRLRWLPLAYLAVVVQMMLLEVAPADFPGAVARAIHLFSYALGALVVLRNARVPGVPILALGGALNLAAIVANGGVMPAAPAAMRVAGLQDGPGFENSAVVEDARLLPLGDVFAIPEALPFSNVFSIGDLVLVLGAFVLMHEVCHSSWARRWQRVVAAARCAVSRMPNDRRDRRRERPSQLAQPPL